MNKLILAILLSLPIIANAQVSGPGNTFGFRSQVNVPLDLDGDGCKETIEIGDYDGDGSLEITDDIEAAMDALVGASGLACSTGSTPFLTTAPKHVTLIPGIFRASETNNAWPTASGDYIRYGLFLTVPSDTLFECPMATGSASAATVTTLSTPATATNDGAFVRSLTVIRAPAWADTLTGQVVGITDDRRNYSVVGSAMNGPIEAGNGSKNIIIRGCEFDGNMGTDYVLRTVASGGTFPTRMVGRFHECTDCRVERNFFHSSPHAGLYGKLVNGFVADGNRISHYGNYNAAQTADAHNNYGQAGFYAYTTKTLGDMNSVIFRNNFVQHGSAGAITRRDVSSGPTGSDGPFPTITNVFFDDNMFEDLRGNCFLLGGVSGGHAVNTVCREYTGGRLFESHLGLSSRAVGSYRGDIQNVDNFAISGLTMYPSANVDFALNIGPGLEGVLLENIYIDGQYQLSSGCVNIDGPAYVKIRNMTLRRCGSELEQAAIVGTILNPGYATSSIQSAFQVTTGWNRIYGSACPGTNCGQGILDIDGLDIEGYYTAAFYMSAPISGQVWKNVSISGGRSSAGLGSANTPGGVYALRTLGATDPIYDMTFENWNVKAVPDPWAYRGEYTIAAPGLPTCQETLASDLSDRFADTWIIIEDAADHTDITTGGGTTRNSAYCVLDSATSIWGWELFRTRYAEAFSFIFGMDALSGRFIFRNIQFDWADSWDGAANYAIDFNAQSVQPSTFAGTILDGVTIRGHEIGPYEHALMRGIRTGSAIASDWRLSGSTDGTSTGEEPICVGLDAPANCIVFHVP